MQRYPANPETTYKKGVISLDNVYLGYHLDNRVIIGRLTLSSGTKLPDHSREIFPKNSQNLFITFRKNLYGTKGATKEISLFLKDDNLRVCGDQVG